MSLLIKKILQKIKNMEIERIENNNGNNNGTAIMYPDGTMIQYGSVLNNSNGLITVSFPKRFYDTNVVVTTSIAYNSYTSINPVSTLVLPSNSTVGIYSRKKDGSTETNTTVKINWQAIGRWK